MPDHIIQKIRNNSKLLTPIETAEILGVSPGTLQIWRTTKRYPLPYVKVGRTVKYRCEDVDAFIESRRIVA